MPTERTFSRGLTDYDKRLKILRQQHFGGNQHTDYRLPASRLSSTQARGEPTTAMDSDITFLKQDLTKIAIFALSAIAIEFLTYFALKNSLIKLPF